MEREKVPIIKHMLWLLPATWSQLRTLGMVFMHSFRKRETVNYRNNRSICHRATAAALC